MPSGVQIGGYTTVGKPRFGGVQVGCGGTHSTGYGCGQNNELHGEGSIGQQLHGTKPPNDCAQNPPPPAFAHADSRGMRCYRRRWNRMHGDRKSQSYPADNRHERSCHANTNPCVVRGDDVKAVRNFVKKSRRLFAGAGFSQDLATRPRPPWNHANILRGPSLVPLRHFAWPHGDQAARES